MWPHFYFVKLVYNIIKANSTLYGNNKFHGTIFQRVFGKEIYVSNKLFTWCFIIGQATILYLILQLHALLPIILYVMCKLLLLYRYSLSFYSFFLRCEKKKARAQKQGWEDYEDYGWTWHEAQKYLWDNYNFLGFFISKGEIYTNGPFRPSNIHRSVHWSINTINRSSFFRQRGIEASFHQFTPRDSKPHLCFFNENRVIGLTTRAKGNSLLPTKKPWLYLINNGNMSIYENEQHYYSIPNNKGSFTDEENWFTMLERDHQKAILIDFFDSAGQEVLPHETDLRNIDPSDLGFKDSGDDLGF